MFAVIPLIGSFQKGNIFRSGDPQAAVWRYMERIGTVDNLTRMAISNGHEPTNARVASLRVRQAVELRKASRGTSPLTRPILLYYSALNLARGTLMTQIGHMGEPGHGLNYQGAETLLSCGARAKKKGGTFVEFSEALHGPKIADYQNKLITLRDVLATIPELASDFALLKAGTRSTAYVEVSSGMRGPMTLRYHLDSVNEDDFAARWQEMLPWLASECEITAPFTLTFKVHPKDESEVAERCKKYLLHDLQWRDNAVWHDHVVGNDITLFTRPSAYLAALFILSNVCRYEPELMDDATRDPTDLAYVINTFLDHVERYFPQLILEALYGIGMFFL
jgi:YaaC-like Protein